MNRRDELLLDVLHHLEMGHRTKANNAIAALRAHLESEGADAGDEAAALAAKLDQIPVSAPPEATGRQCACGHLESMHFGTFPNECRSCECAVLNVPPVATEGAGDVPLPSAAPHPVIDRAIRQLHSHRRGIESRGRVGASAHGDTFALAMIRRALAVLELAEEERINPAVPPVPGQGVSTEHDAIKAELAVFARLAASRRVSAKWKALAKKHQWDRDYCLRLLKATEELRRLDRAEIARLKEELAGAYAAHRDTLKAKATPEQGRETVEAPSPEIVHLRNINRALHELVEALRDILADARRERDAATEEVEALRAELATARALINALKSNRDAAVLAERVKWDALIRQCPYIDGVAYYWLRSHIASGTPSPVSQAAKENS